MRDQGGLRAPPDPGDVVDAYLLRLADVIDGISREDIWTVVERLLTAREAGQRVYLLGNGGSASTASHMANDLNKQCAVANRRRFRAIALSDNIPTMLAWANDQDYADIFREQLVNHLDPGDVVIAISTSGESLNVLRAVEYATDRGATTIGLTGDRGGRLKSLVDHCVCVPTDHIGQQEDLHLVLNHVISAALVARLSSPDARPDLPT
jgi:D-sedoheptulose 7-phosphate isomerase